MTVAGGGGGGKLQFSHGCAGAGQGDDNEGT